MQNKDEFLDNDFNLFRIIEILIKQKIIVILTILACLLIGYFYNNHSKNELIILNAHIDLGNNWSKSFTKDLKHVHLYPKRSFTEKTAEISINTNSTIEYQRYNLYNFLQVIEDKVIDISSFSLFERFALFINNQSYKQLFLESQNFLNLSENKKKEISQALKSIQMNVSSDDSFTIFDKITLTYISSRGNINEEKNNLIFIVDTIEDLVRNDLITQLNVLLSNYTSNLGKEYVMNIQVIQKLNEATLFKLNEHLKVAKELNIKKNTDIIFSDLNLSYYLKGYELIENEIKILNAQMKRDSENLSNTNTENISIKYLKNDIKLLENAGEDFEIIRFNIVEESKSTGYKSIGIFLLSFMIGLILSIFLVLTIENYKIYKKQKKIN